MMEKAFLVDMRYVINFEQISALLVLRFPDLASGVLATEVAF